MNRRTLVVALVLLLIGGWITMNRWRAPQRTARVLPATGSEPIVPVVPLMPVTPTLPPAAPVIEPPALSKTAPAPSRAKRFWGNRGFVVKDRQPTFIKPSEIETLKRDYLSAP